MAVAVALTGADHAPASNPFSRSPKSQFSNGGFQPNFNSGGFEPNFNDGFGSDIDVLNAPPAFVTPAPFTNEVAPIFRNNPSPTVPGAIDFSQAQRTSDGRLCVIKESSVETLAKDPILECIHKNVQKCHYTYVTQFEPAQEEVCEENFEKVVKLGLF